MPEEIFVAMCLAMALCIPIIALITSHKRKMEELRLRRSQGDGNLVSELQALRHQIAELRDTTTRYDMSFDAALQRVESRVGLLESHSAVSEQAPPELHDALRNGHS